MSATLAQLEGSLQGSGGALCRNCYCALPGPTLYFLITFYGTTEEIPCYQDASYPIPEGYTGVVGARSELFTGFPSDLLPAPLYEIRNATWRINACLATNVVYEPEFAVTQTLFAHLVCNAEFEEEEDVWTPHEIVVDYVLTNAGYFYVFVQTVPLDDHTDYSGILGSGDPPESIEFDLTPWAEGLT